MFVTNYFLFTCCLAK